MALFFINYYNLKHEQDLVVIFSSQAFIIFLQSQAHSRTVETTRSISNITVGFFKTLDSHASKLTDIVEEAQTVHEEKLSDFEKKFEVVTFLLFIMHVAS